MVEQGSVPQQAAAIPFRRDGDGVQVCIIRKRDSERWGIPKGLVDPGDTPEQTALTESLEEAGLEGQLVGEQVGTYAYKKWRTTFSVAVFLLEVHKEQEIWLEARLRERRWVPLGELASLLKTHPVWPLLNRVRSRLEDNVS